MKEPLVIECNLMLPKEMMKKVREDIIKQVEDEVVVLPPGLRLANVDVSLLEKIKEEIQGLIDFEESCCENAILGYECLDVIDKYISELKEGEQNGI